MESIPWDRTPYWDSLFFQVESALLVRTSCKLSSPQCTHRLEEGAIIRQLEQRGNRLRYELVAGTGSGPNTGWVSIEVHGNLMLKVVNEPGNIIDNTRKQLKKSLCNVSSCSTAIGGNDLTEVVDSQIRSSRSIFTKQRIPLMPPVQAQLTKVVRLPCFLNEEDINFIQKESVRAHAECLVARVSKNENGKCVEGPGSVWETTFLHTDRFFTTQMSIIRSRILAAALTVDASNWQLLKDFDASSVNFRSVEYHTYRPGGKLCFEKHFDGGSLITVDIMLSEPGVDFTGGEFTTLEVYDQTSKPEFGLGDALVFVSHKYHNVLPILEGKRCVLVCELWDGPERYCAHRCEEDASLPCHHTWKKSCCLY